MKEAAVRSSTAGSAAVDSPLNDTGRVGALAGEFGNDFRLNAKPIFFDLNRFDKWGFEGFVPRFHVSQIDIGQHIWETLLPTWLMLGNFASTENQTEQNHH